jgi:hypothetical protein
MLRSPDKEKFFSPMNAVRVSPFFHSDDGPIAPTLFADAPSGRLELEPQTEWDIKDAEAGTLWYYAPTTHNLQVYRDEVVDVRDYILGLLSEDANTDISRRNWTDTVRASKHWHEEQRRKLEEEMCVAAEAAKVLADAQHRAAVPVEGIDWFRALDEPFQINGRKLMLVRLVSARALKYESYVLDHCVHTYGESIFNGKTIIMSVRDLESIETPLITIEFYSEELKPPYLIQIRGIHNHDANQTVYGIEQAVRRLEFPTRSICSLGKSGDLSFYVDRNAG